MKCRHCGLELKLSKEERSAVMRKAIRESIGRNGARRKFDYDEIKILFDQGLSLKDIATRVGGTTPGVSQALRKIRGPNAPKNKQGVKRTYDYNKILELRNAGHKLLVIAEMVGGTVGGVARVLHNIRRDNADAKT